MSLSTLKILGVLLFLGSVPAANAQTYDPAADFSPTSNPNGVWSYGWTQTLGSTFNLDAIHENASGLDFWEGSVHTGAGFPPGNFPNIGHNGTNSTITYNGAIPVAPGHLTLHPGPDGEYSVIRFTAQAKGIYSLSSTFTGLDPRPTSTDVHVLMNASSIFDGSVTAFGSGPSFSDTLALKAGDIIDFAVGYGSNHTYNSDTTGLNASLRPVPAPNALLTTLMGAVPGATLLLRRRGKAAA